ncbi:MAG: hypothetical protein KDD94_00860 [Calditrichaeota bacterium]|nr:hypothetical protein [Calditrichota bacterium]
MDLQTIRNAYLRYLELNSYPADIVNRRGFTYQRFIDHHETLDSVSLQCFYESNDFLRPHSWCLLRLDLLAWLRYMEKEGLINGDMWLRLDRGSEEVM